jgi:hypothetical protein
MGIAPREFRKKRGPIIWKAGNFVINERVKKVPNEVLKTDAKENKRYIYANY